MVSHHEPVCCLWQGQTARDMIWASPGPKGQMTPRQRTFRYLIPPPNASGMWEVLRREVRLVRCFRRRRGARVLMRTGTCGAQPYRRRVLLATPFFGILAVGCGASLVCLHAA